MLVHYPLNLLRIITFPKHSKGLVSRKSRAISPPKCICHIQKGYTSQMSNRSFVIHSLTVTVRGVSTGTLRRIYGNSVELRRSYRDEF